MSEVMIILYNALLEKVIKGLESYNRMYHSDQLAKKYAHNTSIDQEKRAAINTYNRSAITTRNFGKSVLNDYVMAEDTRNRIIALDANANVKELPSLSFIKDQQLKDYYPQAMMKYQENERKKRIPVNNIRNEDASSPKGRLRAKVLQQRNEYQSCVTRLLEAERNRMETSKKISEIEDAMIKFPLKEQKSEKYFSLDQERLVLIGQLGKLNSVASKLSSDKFLKETSFTISNGELFTQYGEKYTIDDIKAHCDEEVIGHQNNQLTREQLQNETRLLESLDKTYKKNETNLERARNLFRKVEQQIRNKIGTVDEHEMNKLIHDYKELQSSLDEKEANYNFILSKIRIAYNILQYHQAKLNENQRNLLKDQMESLNVRTNLNQSVFAPVVSLEPYEQTAKICIEKLLQKKDDIQRKLAINKQTLDKISNEVLEKSNCSGINSTDFDELAFIQEEVVTIDQENSELITNLNNLNSKLFAQVEDVKKNCSIVSAEFYEWINEIFKGLMGISSKKTFKSKIPVRIKNPPKIAISKTKSTSKSPLAKSFRKQMFDAAKILHDINNDPIMKNECQTFLDKFYNELKRSHRKRVGCTKIINDISKDKQNVNDVLKSQLLTFLLKQ